MTTITTARLNTLGLYYRSTDNPGYAWKAVHLCATARAPFPQWIVTYLLEASTRILSGPADARALGFPPIKGRNRGLALKADQRAVRAAAEFGAYHRIEWKKTGGPRLNAVAARAAAFGNFRDGSWISGRQQERIVARGKAIMKGKPLVPRLARKKRHQLGRTATVITLPRRH